jgi:hypothetical protein
MRRSEEKRTMKKENKFNEMLINLEKRGGMYVSPFTYSSLAAYITGYDHAVMDLDGNSNLEGMQELVARKYGRYCSLHWIGIIRELLSESDETAIANLFYFCKQLKEIKNQRGLQFLKEEYKRLGSLKRKIKSDVNWPANNSLVEDNKRRAPQKI